MLVEPKLNPVAGAAAEVVAVPNAGAVRAAGRNQTDRQTRNQTKQPDQSRQLEKHAEKTPLKNYKDNI